MSERGYVHFQAKVKEQRHTVPKKHITRGWSASYIGEADAELQLNWEQNIVEQLNQYANPVYKLRITNAVDFRDEQHIEVCLSRSRKMIGEIQVRFSYTFQFFELEIPSSMIQAVISEGITLRCKMTEEQLWIFNDHNLGEHQQYFTPQILVLTKVEDKVTAAIESLLSNKSLQPFGWIEGCVLDGIASFVHLNRYPQAGAALQLHLKQFVTDDGRLTYEDLHGNIADGTFKTIEATLPIAIIAKHNPDHPLINEALIFFQQKLNDSDLIIDDDMVSAEGCYTVAYPLAVIAKTTNNRMLAEQSIKQILLRKQYLTDESNVYLRHMLNSKTHTFQNWSRAYGWYTLGLVKTYCELLHSPFHTLEHMDLLRAEITRISDLTIKYRQPHGLWNVFFDHADGSLEASGSAAVAAALALAYKYEIIDKEYERIIFDCYEALNRQLTWDGLMSNVSQHNAGGMQLQLSSYRVLSQMGLGLWGQLHCVIQELQVKKDSLSS